MAGINEQEIFEQIEALKKKLLDNRMPALEEIRKKIDAYNFTAEELGFEIPKPAPVKRKSNKEKMEEAAASVPPKYKNEEGKTWSGRGLPPKWMAGEDGKTDPKKKEKYAIKE